MVLFQGQPTESMKEAEPLQYGASKARDYIPGAEALREALSDEGENDGDSLSICFQRTLTIIARGCFQQFWVGSSGWRREWDRVG